jgi:uncharacterized protein
MAHFLSAVVARPGLHYCLRNERTGLTVAGSLEPAFDSTTRRRGLLGRSGLDPDIAIVLAPCSSIHTFFMKFAIDVVFVRMDGVVTKVCRGVKPWRAVAAFGAFAAIELSAGSANRAGIQRFDRMLVDTAS